MTPEQRELDDERGALISSVRSFNRAIEAIKRKRSWRESERAMSLAEVSRHRDAIERVIRKHYGGTK